MVASSKIVPQARSCLLHEDHHTRSAVQLSGQGSLYAGGFFFGTFPSGQRVQEVIHRGATWPLFKAPMLELKALWKGEVIPFGSAYNCAIGDTVTAGKPQELCLAGDWMPRMRLRIQSQPAMSILRPFGRLSRMHAMLRLVRALGSEWQRCSCCCTRPAVDCVICHSGPSSDPQFAIATVYDVMIWTSAVKVSGCPACCRPGAGRRVL